MSDVKPKLYYFGVRGRGELVRLVFAATNTQFEDIRYTREEWPEHKKDSPTGMLPYVDTGDSSHGLLVQSGAIARFYARKGGLMGSSDWEYYLIERALGQLEDVLQELIKVWLAPEDKKAELLKEYHTEKGPKLLKSLVDFLKENGGGFYAGSTVSLADLASITVTDNLSIFGTELADKFPELREHKERVMAANAGVAEWIRSRPVTPH